MVFHFSLRNRLWYYIWLTTHHCIIIPLSYGIIAHVAVRCSSEQVQISCFLFIFCSFVRFISHTFAVVPCQQVIPWPHNIIKWQRLPRQHCLSHSTNLLNQSKHSQNSLVDQATLCPAAKKWEIHALLIPLNAFLTVEMVCYKNPLLVNLALMFVYSFFGVKRKLCQNTSMES